MLSELEFQRQILSTRENRTQRHRPPHRMEGCVFNYILLYSAFPKVVARGGLKTAKFPKVVAFAQPKLVAQPKVVAFSAQLLLETYYSLYKKNGANVDFLEVVVIDFSQKSLVYRGNF